MEIAVLEAKDGTQILEITKDGKKYRLNSLYKPFDEAKKFASQLDDVDPGHVIIVFGYGNGIFPNEIIHKYAKKGIIVFYEPCDELMNLYIGENVVDFTSKKEKIYIVTNEVSQKDNNIYSRKELAGLLEKIITYTTYNKVKCIELPQYRNLFYDELERLYKDIQYRINYIKLNINTAGTYGKEAIVNNIMNLQYVKDSYCADSFVGVFPEELPAIIVSAGPSLKKNVHLLTKMKNHSLILCVDTTINYLLNEGIIPDIIIAVDAVKPMALFANDKINGIPIAVGSDVNYRILKKFNDSKIIFVSSENIYIQNLYKMSGHDIEKLKSGGSVANLAFSLCLYWKFNRIILVGQDLALSGDDMYADNTINTDNLELGDLIEIKDIYGERIYTYRDYYSYLKWFEQIIMDNADVDVIDATEGGALIEGTRIQTLTSVIDQYSQIDCSFAEVLDSIDPAFDESGKRMISERIDNTEIVLKELNNKLEEGIAISKNTLELIINKKEFPSYEVDKRLYDICSYYDKLDEKFYIQREIDATELERFVSLFDNMNEASEERKYEKMIEYFECIKRATATVKKDWDKYTKEIINE